jgi:hypothetical protein
VEDLSVAAVSVLQRRELAYATNRYPVGFAQGFSTSTYAVDVGEESRHNSRPWEIGYGHVMLLGLQSLVDPMSRGVLVDDDDADYPPLVDACDEAHRQGGVAIWCHSGKGMEAPVAAALGKLDAFNLFDPYWQDPEWDVWYALLNCGVRLPASTGSDWFVCSSNRVYVHTGAGGDHSHYHADDHTHAPGTEPHTHYRRWLDGLGAGTSFITNGPVISIEVEGKHPGDSLPAGGGASPAVTVTWRAAQPIQRIELIRNGRVVERAGMEEGRTEGSARWTIAPLRAGEWLAARCFGNGRTSYGHVLWAHTSPIYAGDPPSGPVDELGRVLPALAATPEARESARFFVAEIDRGMEWIRSVGRYRESAHRERMLELFRAAQERFRSVATTR